MPSKFFSRNKISSTHVMRLVMGLVCLFGTSCDCLSNPFNQNRSPSLHITPKIIKEPNNMLKLTVKNISNKRIKISDINLHIKDTRAYQAWVAKFKGSNQSDLGYKIYLDPSQKLGKGEFFSIGDNETSQNPIISTKKISPQSTFRLLLASEAGFTDLQDVTLTFVADYQQEAYEIEVKFPKLRSENQPSGMITE